MDGAVELSGTQGQVSESPCETPSPVSQGKLLGRELDELEEKRLLRRGGGNGAKMRILYHSMALNQGIDDVAATEASVPLQPHGMKTFLKIDQIVFDHQPFTSRARHTSLPSDRQYGPRKTRKSVTDHTATGPSPHNKQTECHRLDTPFSSPVAQQSGGTVEPGCSRVLFCVRIGLMGQEWVQSATVTFDRTAAGRTYRMGHPSDGWVIGLAYK